MKATKCLLESCWDYASKLVKEYGKDEESLKKAAAEKASEFVSDVAELLPKAIVEVASMLCDIISELAHWLTTYYNGLKLGVASEDSEHIKGRKRQSFILPRLLTHVWRSSAKLWKVNRAIYRPYVGLLECFVFDFGGACRYA